MTGLNELSTEGQAIILFLAILALGLSIKLIGHFMSKRDAAITTATDNLIKAVEQLQIIVNGLQMQYAIRQPILDEKMKDYGNHLKNLETRLSNLETEHKLYHCNYEPQKQKP